MSESQVYCDYAGFAQTLDTARANSRVSKKVLIADDESSVRQ